jgi:hypothetical protein
VTKQGSKSAQQLIPTSWKQVLECALPRPQDSDSREEKKNYAERLSRLVARYVAYRLRELGAETVVPDDKGGDEKRFAGGIGDKKVDVSMSSPSHGLILSIGIKSINFPDRKTKNYQKNLTNRRGDLLAEATSLHQRFPYAVVGGLFLFDKGADCDNTERRPSTVQTAHQMFQTFANRKTRSDAVESYEAMGIVLYSGNEPRGAKYYDVGDPATERDLDEFLGRLLRVTAERNPDKFRYFNGRLQKVGGPDFSQGGG